MKYGRTVVYRIFHAETGEVLYIGMSSDLRKRLISHRCPSGRYRDTPIVVKATRAMSHSEAMEMERRLIRKYQPRDNTVFTDRHPVICRAARAQWVAIPSGERTAGQHSRRAS